MKGAGMKPRSAVCKAPALCTISLAPLCTTRIFIAAPFGGTCFFPLVIGDPKYIWSQSPGKMKKMSFVFSSVVNAVLNVCNLSSK